MMLQAYIFFYTFFVSSTNSGNSINNQDQLKKDIANEEAKKERLLLEFIQYRHDVNNLEMQLNNKSGGCNFRKQQWNSHQDNSTFWGGNANQNDNNEIKQKLRVARENESRSSKLHDDCDRKLKDLKSKLN